MIQNDINEKPCLVETKQGFSICYKNRFLYSKYNPSKLIIDKINSLTILPGTLILCFSPVLPYGLQELQSKLPENCQLLLCEFDENLRNFIKKNSSTFIIPDEKEIYDLPSILNYSEYSFSDGNKLLPSGSFKRILRIDFSAGVQFNEKLFNQLEEACIISIRTFWANRVTLTKFGRKYTRNLFANLKHLNSTKPVNDFFSSISKPIICFGAAPSLEDDIDYIFANKDSFYILCADTALQPLLQHNIVPDGVFIEEAQNVISKAFIGTQDYNFQLFAGLSSLPLLFDLFSPEKISYFTTKYTDSNFLNNIISEGILPSVNKPFGSVGITTVYYALLFRKNTSVPVFYYGLDFSYPAGFTHTRGAMAHTTRLLSQNKLIPVQNYSAAFGSNAIKLSEDNSRFSTPTLLNYKNLFINLFENQNNLFSGNVRECKLTKTCDSQISDTTKTENFFSDPIKYIESEKESLIYLRDLLTGKITMSEKELKKEITELCINREYLYLSFPDGWKFNYTQSFLNRIRTEIDFFLKWL